MRLILNMISVIIPFLCASVLAQTEAPGADISEVTYSYLRISDEGTGGGFRLQPSTGSYEVLTGLPLGGGKFEADFCTYEANLHCFYAPIHERYFAVPKKMGNQKNWTFRERDYELVRSEPMPDCGTNYIIHSRDGNILKEAYVFNDRLGLTMIAETSLYFISQTSIYVHGEDLDDIETIETDVPSFTVYIANGTGFGGSGKCEGIPAR